MESYLELGMLDEIVHNLEQSNHIARIKKLVFCACTNNWSNEAQQLSPAKFASYIQQLRDSHASIVELKYLLYRIVIRLNHSTNYYTVANFLCQEMEPLYTQLAETTIAPSNLGERLQPQVMWGREVIFAVEETQAGAVLQIEMSVLAANRQLLTQMVVNLPGLEKVFAQYQEWQSRYRRLDPQNHRLMSNKAVSLVPERINDCLDAGAMLQAHLHQWYTSPGFQTLRDRLATTLDPDREVDLIVRSRSKAAIELPWNTIWQPLLDRYPQAEVSISIIPILSGSTVEPELKVAVLSVLASAQGIKLDRSKEYLDALPHTEAEFLVAPSHADFASRLTQSGCSVLFISSYISGYLPNNRIYLNHHDTISLAELKYRIRLAIERGLKLLILNCGDGLELASKLADLQIPYLIVMREAVQDQVAQEFVKLLLKSFSGGKSLPLAAREAREKLQAIEKVVPAASWLPVVCMQTADAALNWHRIAHIVAAPVDSAELVKHWSDVEATGMINWEDPAVVPVELATLPKIPYERLTLVHQLTGYFSEVYSLALSADGRWLVSGHGDITHVDDAVKVWRLSDGQLIHNLLGHSHWIYSVILTPDAETIISGSLDGTLQWWQLTTGAKLPQLVDNKSAVNAIALTSDGQRLVTGGNDATLRIWQPENALLIHQCQGHLQNIACLAVHKQANLVASGSSDYTVRLWQIQEGRLLRTLLGHSSRVSGVAITPDGTKVISASHDRTIKIWEVATGTLLNTLVGHAKPIGCVAISPDGQTIFSGGDDRLVKIWNLSDGTLVHTLSGHDRAILSIAISTDGRTIATGSYGEIQIWQVPV
jgi:hypothetical protein